MAENAVDFVVIALVYPLGVLGFLMTVLKDSDKPYVVAACGLPLAFAVFPWLLLRNVFPNILGFALVFSEMALFIEWVSLAESPRHFAMVLLLLFLGMAGLGLAHPNSVFTVGVLAAPFVTYLIGIACTKRFSGRAGFLAAVAFVMLACVIWYVAFRLPALGGIVSFKWPSFETPWQALRDIVLVGYRAAPIQLLLAAIVALGCVRALFVGSYRWMFFPFAVSAVMYFVNATSDGFFKSLLTGFWYTDSYRIAAMLAMFAVPMASIGMVLICQKVLDAIVSRLKTSAKDAHVLSICAAATILFCLANYYPALPSPGYSNTAFGFARSTIRWQNLQSRSDDLYLLTDEEREFVSLVLEVVPDGALVLNEPYDGSVYTYGAYGLNVYYRMFTEYGETPNESAASVLLREELPTVSTSDDVRELLNDLDAEYLLLLDAGGEDLTRQTMISFHEDAWAGIDGIGDDTPGFEVVLSEGDMRLYRISHY